MQPTTDTPYPHIFTPLDVHGVTLPNRILMGSMHVGLEEERGRLDKLAEYFRVRAAGGVGLIVTGGVSPNWQGMLKPFGAKLSNRYEVWKHRRVTDAVHSVGGKICVQILHAGRYGYTPWNAAPSPLKSPITPFAPRALSTRAVSTTIEDFVHCARKAQEAGYDGVEVMGSEGYLINQFIVRRTNKRTDQWGGEYDARIQFPLQIVRRMRAAVGDRFIIIFRLSMLDLVEDGSTWEEVVQLAKALESEGVSILNTGIGWHEARVPTIATMVPRGAYSWVTRRLRGEVSIPTVTSNRINMPDVAEDILAEGDADMVSMARPFLADPDWVIKASRNEADTINTCIACNQACLDLVFQNKRASCLVNPRACYESEMPILPTTQPIRVAVVGAGPAGMAYASTAAERGHQVTLYEKAPMIGGQFNIAARIPGKHEFLETIRYFGRRLQDTGVTIHLNTVANEKTLEAYDKVAMCTGVRPRTPVIEGIDHPTVLSYLDVLVERKPVGKRVAIIGAGGIGFDVAEFLCHTSEEPETLDEYLAEWGVDTNHTHAGGLKEREVPESPREVYLCQRKTGKIGAGLGKTTGWIHRATLKNRGVHMMAGCTYVRIDDAGLHIQIDGKDEILEVDNVVICAGQLSANEMVVPLQKKGVSVDVLGGAALAAELDARRAIDEGVRMAIALP